MSINELKGDTKNRILTVSEKLFALHGLDAVSMRQISAEVGQRNKTAAQYHFGSKEGLVKAILLSRMTVINAQRQTMLDACLAAGDYCLRDLIAVLYEPFVNLLLDETGGPYYVRFLAQLFAQGKAVELLAELHLVYDTQRHLFRLIKQHLSYLPTAVIDARLQLMAGLLVQATAAKGYELELLNKAQSKRQVNKFSEMLLDFVEGGLAAEIDITEDQNKN